MAAKPKPDARQCFNLANSFHEGSIRCGENVLDPVTGTHHSPQTPELVNAAFAAELYMKALALRRVPEVNGHNLQWLYENALDDAERSAISGHYQVLLGSSDEWLTRNLEQFARAFTAWRYVYEVDERFINSAALMAFVKAAYLTVRDVAPEWPVSDYSHGRFTAHRETVAVMYDTTGRSVVDAAAKFGFNLPHADITKGDQQNLGFVAPVVDLDSEAATIKTKVDGIADPEVGSPN